jgi:hypothetical protein
MMVGRIAVGMLLALLASGAAHAADTVVLTLKDHKFVPDNVTVPTSQRFRIEVRNTDPTVEEFESHDMKLEKIVMGGGTITMNAGPLKPGTYKFFGEYHPDTAFGTITVAPPAPN